MARASSGTLNAVLLAWYEPRRTAFPWRRDEPDPYRVLVSEVMLQQTQVSRVLPAFDRFVRRFPTLEALAEAPRAEVLRAWAGLGYNRRGLALSETARRIAAEHSGRIPADPASLRRLPGIGSYTAAAIASIAFGTPVPAVDTNIARVVARMWSGDEPDALSNRVIRDQAARWLDRERPGAWNQALMDLGREVCRPVPRCERCPLAGSCRFRRKGGRPRRVQSRQPPFRGSSREVRGAVVRALRAREVATMARLSVETGHSVDRLTVAVTSLQADGLVAAGPAALRGRPAGRVRLAAG